MLSHIKSNDNKWTVVTNGKPYQFDASHVNYSDLVSYVMNGREQEFLQSFDTKTVIEDWSNGNFDYKNGFLYYQGEMVDSHPTQRIVSLIKSGHAVKPILSYLDNLYQNVSHRSVQESYKWCSNKGIPITEDGMLVGYKGVLIYKGNEIKDLHNRIIKDGDYVDKFTGKSYRNNIGDINEVPRRTVCDDANVGCAQGLHVGTYEYAVNWAGDRGVVVLVKFNPKDIVSVPKDENCHKMRVCRYEVIGVAREQLSDDVYKEENEDEEQEEAEDENGYHDDEDENEDNTDIGNNYWEPY